jgi:branched-chain amino acid transport system substrate-binding protein
MKKMLSLIAVLALVISTVCLPALAEAPKPVQIGAISPNTGNLAAYGTAVSNGIKLAVEEINAAGGVLGGRPLEVIAYMDDKADSTEGANAFNKLVADGAKAIIGSVTSGVTAGLATLATEQNMLLLTATATNDSITGPDKPTVFRACYKDSFQGANAAKLAVDLGVKKVAVLYASGDPYSAGLYESFKAASAELGLELVATESSSGVADTDYTAQLTNIAASGAELIFAPYYYDTIGPYIVPQARAAGFTGYMAGADGWDGTIATMVEDKSLYNKCFFVNHYSPDDPSEKVQSFVKAYSDKFSKESLNALAPLAYDSVYMLAQAINAAGTDDTAAIVAAMKGMSFVGVTGSFTLDETGTPIKPVAFIEFVDGVAKFYKSL